MATEKQLEANRRNAQRSSGPRTQEGKERSRQNALEHGLTAEALVIVADEDADELAGRIGGWLRDLGGRNEVEESLIRRAALLSWKLDRGDRHEDAVLNRKVREQMEVDRARHRERVQGQLARLLPMLDEVRQGGFDPTPTAELLAGVESTAEGCGWLLGCWERIRGAAAGGISWTCAEEMGIVRLLGHGRGASVAPEALDLVVASRVLMKPIPPDADHWDPGLFGLEIDREALRAACRRHPASQAEASRVLLAAAEKAVSRLEVIRDLRDREGDAWGAAESARVAMFDASAEGELHRRYQTTNHRQMIRTLESVSKLRLQATKVVKQEWLVEPLRNEADSPGARVASMVPEPEADPNPPRNEANSSGVAGVDDPRARSPRGSMPAELEASPRNEANFDDLDGVEWIDVPGFGEAVEAPSALLAAS